MADSSTAKESITLQRTSLITRSFALLLRPLARHLPTPALAQEMTIPFILLYHNLSNSRRRRLVFPLSLKQKNFIFAQSELNLDFAPD